MRYRSSVDVLLLKIAVVVSILLALGGLSVAVVAYAQLQSLQLQVHKLAQSQPSGRAQRTEASLGPALKELAVDVKDIEASVVELSDKINLTDLNVDMLKEDIGKMQETLLVMSETPGNVAAITN